ncbi:nucleolar protein-like protein NOP52 variant [Mytilinidion resinicola]|uniref:Nucleolar protein-like protein NOP52 variant n=1 Tax=Mytilinidion resinicola TaxID=574789 RepID=A0A6A6Y819_9PEZI|nr:nucleolar protein-like protein NOP52 variant [Mytilinidion resinicola]KAF2804830.1 nucleolar protein-like protein NOP52 variant [Mytilinidion resinicola]
MATTAQNTPFIKQFASSDKRIRDKALDSLRTFLSGRSGIEEIELLKLWKGLFYCMWMSDKPLVQQRLAVDLASLVDTLRPEVVLPFLDAFWKIMAREWGNIDALRMNKFLYLIRQYLFASFRYLSRHGWANTSTITGCMHVLAATPLNSTDPKIPNGLRYHVLDIYVDELDRVDADREGKMPLEALLAPVRALDMESKTKAVRKSAREVLTDERLKNWNKVEEDAGEESSGGVAVGGEDDGE